MMIRIRVPPSPALLSVWLVASQSPGWKLATVSPLVVLVHCSHPQVGTPEQSSVLGLRCGQYSVRETLCVDYLPRRYRSALVRSTVASSSAETATKRAMVAVETADDDGGDQDVGAVLRSEETGDNANATQQQNVLSMGSELVGLSLSMCVFVMGL